MTKLVHRNAAYLLIGNELLSGKIEEKNFAELARTLRGIGIDLARAVVVPDDIDVIANEVRELSDQFDVVFTSGGIGPTHDDITIEAVAKAFGVEAHVDPEMLGMLKSAYGERYTEAHARMALVPDGAELKVSAEVPWPTILMKNVWCLPGVPEVFRMKLMVVRAHMRGAREFHTMSVYTKMDEGHLAPLLDRIVLDHPEVDVGSYPKFMDPTYKTKLTFDAPSENEAKASVDQFLSLLPEGEPQRVE